MCLWDVTTLPPFPFPAVPLLPGNTEPKDSLRFCCGVTIGTFPEPIFSFGFPGLAHVKFPAESKRPTFPIPKIGEERRGVDMGVDIVVVAPTVSPKYGSGCPTKTGTDVG